MSDVNHTTTKEPRIDLLIVGDEQFLTSPARPGYRFPVTPENGKDASGVVWSIRQFQKELANG